MTLIYGEIYAQSLVLVYDANGNRLRKEYLSPKPDTPKIIRTQTQLVSNYTSRHEWYRNDTALIGANSNIYPVNERGRFYAVALGDYGCKSAPSNVINVGQYIFLGNGNWSSNSNWEYEIAPPLLLPSGDEIIIDHISNGESILNGTIRIQKGAKLTVRPGKKLTVNGGVIIE